MIAIDLLALLREEKETSTKATQTKEIRACLMPDAPIPSSSLPRSTSSSAFEFISHCQNDAVNIYLASTEAMEILQAQQLQD
jgi:hypothetical protein